MTELRTEPFVAEREWAVEGVPVLRAEVRVPQPEPAADKVSRRVHRFYQLQCRSFLRYCERCLLPQAAAEYRAALAASRPLPLFQAELDYLVTYNQGGLWSLYTQTREALGKSVSLGRRGDTWDLAAGYPVPFWFTRKRKSAAGSGPGRAAGGRTGGGSSEGTSIPKISI